MAQGYEHSQYLVKVVEGLVSIINSMITYSHTPNLEMLSHLKIVNITDSLFLAINSFLMFWCQAEIPIQADSGCLVSIRVLRVVSYFPARS